MASTFISFLKALPPDLGMAYVVVPHLDPTHESQFSQILARATRMPVVEVTDGMRPEANHVYIIPPNCILKISKALLHIEDRHEPRAINTTIDLFLRSLAADQKSNAIGVILSGTGTDGTLGLSAIKGEGGITFAQNTASAKYDGMPASAIAAGCVDFILTPEKIAEELDRIRHHPYVSIPASDESETEDGTPDASLAQIFRLLRRATRVNFSEYRRRRSDAAFNGGWHCTRLRRWVTMRLCCRKTAMSWMRCIAIC